MEESEKQNPENQIEEKDEVEESDDEILEEEIENREEEKKRKLDASSMYGPLALVLIAGASAGIIGVLNSFKGFGLDDNNSPESQIPVTTTTTTNTNLFENDFVPSDNMSIPNASTDPYLGNSNHILPVIQESRNNQQTNLENTEENSSGTQFLWFKIPEFGAAKSNWNLVKEYFSHTYPLDDSKDSDGDYLSDDFEKRYSLDPKNKDTDGDGIDDLFDNFTPQEVTNLIYTSGLDRLSSNFTSLTIPSNFKIIDQLEKKEALILTDTIDLINSNITNESDKMSPSDHINGYDISNVKEFNENLNKDLREIYIVYENGKFDIPIDEMNLEVFPYIDWNIFEDQCFRPQDQYYVDWSRFLINFR